MAEPLKNSFGSEIPERIAEMIANVYDTFDKDAFLADALDGYEELELTQRAKKISAALAVELPSNREHALEILIASLDVGVEESELTGMDSFLYCPHGYFIAEQGLDCFETSMRAQYELTKRFTAEFSIRTYLDRFPEKTLAQLHVWASDPSEHVRRLVSEGTRPRLPWAPRLREFQKDPAPVIKLLDLLKDDPEEYVRRSVANNLNDISKDHPDVVIEVARKWWKSSDKNRTRLLRHGLRTLIKRANPDALALLGYGVDSPAVIAQVSCIPEIVSIGGKVRIQVLVENPTDAEINVLVDMRVFFLKADGSSSPRVFKGAEKSIGPGENITVGKTLSVAQHTTRKHYPGIHRIEIMLNGATHDGVEFEII